MLTKIINVLVIIAVIMSVLISINALRVAEQNATETALTQIEIEESLVEMSSKLEDMQSQLDNVDTSDSAILYQEIEDMIAELDQRYLDVANAMIEGQDALWDRYDEYLEVLTDHYSE